MAAALLCPAGLFAQQVLKLNNGYTYTIRIVSQTPDTLKFSLASDPTVILTVPSSQVLSIRNLKSYESPRDTAFLQKKVSKYTTMAIAGGVLAGAGLATSIVLTNNLNHAESVGQAFGTVFGTAIAVIATAGGTVLAIIGTANAVKYQKKLRNVKIEVEPAPAISGATVRVRF